MKKYISTIVLIIIVILLVIGLGYSFKLVIRKDKDLAVLSQQNKDLNETISNLNGKIETLQDEQEKQEEKEPTENNNIVNIPILDKEKIINKPENTNIEENIYANNGVLSVNVDNDSNSLNIVLDGQLARQIYGYKGQTENHTIAGISDKIIDAKIVSTGKDANSIKVVILLKNGTVKYVDIDSILNKIYNVKTVSNAENIASIVEITMTNNENNETLFAVAGIKTDGSAVIFNFD